MPRAGCNRLPGMTARGCAGCRHLVRAPGAPTWRYCGRFAALLGADGQGPSQAIMPDGSCWEAGKPSETAEDPR